MEEDTATRLEVIVMILMDKCTGRVKAKKKSLQLKIVTRLMDMVAKWLKEHDTREKEIDMIVMERFVTIIPGIRSWVKEHKPETSMIARKLAEHYDCWKLAEDLSKQEIQ